MKNIVGMVVSVKCSVLSSIGGMLCRLILIMMKFMFYVRIMISVSSKFFGVIIGVFFDCWIIVVKLVSLLGFVGWFDICMVCMELVVCVVVCVMLWMLYDVCLLWL